MNLILGDCLEEMKKMPDKSIDLILTDPPYGINLSYDNYDDGYNIAKAEIRRKVRGL